MGSGLASHQCANIPPLGSGLAIQYLARAKANDSGTDQDAAKVYTCPSFGRMVIRQIAGVRLLPTVARIDSPHRKAVMARPLRIELAGGIYHVTSRGDGREDIYRNDADRLTWLDLFAKVCARFNWVCHAWCQMNNHYHVVVETIEANLSGGMRHLNGVYTQTFNRRHDRVGHVFQGRYKAIVVEKDAYLLALARYVVLNPVRARMVSEPGTWPWSSYAAMIGALPAPPWLRTDWILRQFTVDPRRAAMAYVEFVQAGVTAPSIWTELRGQIYLASDKFLATLPQLPDNASFGEVPRAQRRPRAHPLEHYLRIHGARRPAMAAAFASGQYSMREIGDAFGVHYSTVSRAVREGAASSASGTLHTKHAGVLESKT